MVICERCVEGFNMAALRFAGSSSFALNKEFILFAIIQHVVF